MISERWHFLAALPEQGTCQCSARASQQFSATASQADFCKEVLSFFLAGTGLQDGHAANDLQTLGGAVLFRLAARRLHFPVKVSGRDFHELSGRSCTFSQS